MKKNKNKKKNYFINESDTMNNINGERLDVFFVHNEKTNEIQMINLKTGEIIAKS